MFTLLDVSKLAQDPGTSTFAVCLSLLGSAIGFGKFLGWLAEMARQRGYAKVAKEPGTPKAPDPAHAALLARVASAEQEAASARALWRQHDAEQKLREISGERDALKGAVTHERAVNLELLKQTRALRAEVLRLRLALSRSDDVLDLVTVEELAASIPTPMRPPRPMPKGTT